MLKRLTTATRRMTAATTAISPDQPDEKDPLQLTYMGQESHNWTYTYEEAEAKGFETIDYYNQLMLEKHNLEVKAGHHRQRSVQDDPFRLSCVQHA